MKGLIGKKIGMTQVEDSAGSIVAVTVIEAGPCVVVQKKTTDTDGYDAVQLGFIECKEKAHSKAGLGHFKKAGVTPRKYIQEFRRRRGEERGGRKRDTTRNSLSNSNSSRHSNNINNYNS